MIQSQSQLKSTIKYFESILLIENGLSILIIENEN